MSRNNKNNTFLSDGKYYRGNMERKETFTSPLIGTIEVSGFTAKEPCWAFSSKEGTRKTNRTKVFTKGSRVYVFGRQEKDEEVFIFNSGRRDGFSLAGSSAYIKKWEDVRDKLTPIEKRRIELEFKSRGRRKDDNKDYFGTKLGKLVWVHQDLIQWINDPREEYED